ncbi:MAG: L-aspartate oxidase [Polynucleobacter sp.]|nr:L-aspartate oxidase [Polynucleobacter sp.]
MEISRNQHVEIKAHHDVIIIGAGLAGLTVAIEVAKYRDVLVLIKNELTLNASAWAQGGIVGVLDKKDSFELHVADTLEAGAGIVLEAAARYLTQNSASTIAWLLDQGVLFTRDSLGPLGLHLTREGGHTHRRIVHANDSTGRVIHQALLTKARTHPRILFLEHWIAIDLITEKSAKDPISIQSKYKDNNCCKGVHVFDIRNKKALTLTTNHLVLATGGVGQVYQYTTNPSIATGDGQAMAWRAGCRISNMEFIQFHPTTLYHAQERSFLITEALRGEGGYLRLPNGYRFMVDYDSRMELAPRDIVARAIHFELKKHQLDFVMLDVTHLGKRFLTDYFQTIYSKCLSFGIDISTDWIPVVPAAHYSCGGVITNIVGQSDIDQLYVVGEASYTGLHGANRLASNSLLECVVMARAVSQIILSKHEKDIPRVTTFENNSAEDIDESILRTRRTELCSLMWDDVGIVRSTKQLENALQKIELLLLEVNEYYSSFRITVELIELRNLVENARLIVLSALSRKESRGAHFMKDYPQTYALSNPTILSC